MGRTYRRQDKKFKKKLKDGRRARQTKRITKIDDGDSERAKDRKNPSSVGSYLFT